MPNVDTRPELQPRLATYGGVFVITLTALMYEIALTRIFSVTMWFHFAFVAISTALFGLTAGALLVHLVPRWFTDDKVKRQMWRFSLAYAVSVAVVFVMQLAVPFRVELSAAGVFSVLWTPLLISIPFTFAGVVVALALTRFPRRVNRLYAADLVGAGAGAVVLLLAFRFFDGPSLIILVAAITALGAVLFAVDARDRRGAMLATVATLVLALGAVGNNVLAERGDGFVRILWGKDGVPDQDQSRGFRLVDRWNAFSRVTVDGNPELVGEPSGNGMSVNLPVGEFPTAQLGLLIDGTAGTSVIGWDGDEESLGFLRYDASNLGYHALEGRDFSAAIVGVGGGRDVLSALAFGAGQVDGIEINDDILDVVNGELGEFTGNLDQDPRVSFVVDEARSFLTRTNERYDMIQISLIDTWAATSAGAFALTENTLYTTDAWDIFLDRLEPGGVLSLTRWFADETREDFEPFEIIRTTVLAAEVLDRRGVENPRDHIIVYKGPPNAFGVSIGTVLVSAEPFAPEARQTLADVADQMEFHPVLTAEEAPDGRFAEIAAPGGPGPALSQFGANMSAPTDDQPFFFQMASLRSLFTGAGFSEPQVFQSVASLLALGLAVLFIAAVAIGGPLVHMGRRIRHHRRFAPHYLYFAGIGLGFLLVEIAQLIRLSTFLGHPTFALAVVLFTVLVFSGLGSMVVEAFIDLDRPRRLLLPLAALLAVVLVTGLLTPGIVSSQAGATLSVRIAVSVALLVPMSLLMGMPLAIGMRTASIHAAAPTAFLWGINGAMSVVSTVMAMVIAMFFGITMTLLAGWAAYALAAVSMAVVVRRMLTGEADTGDVERPEVTTGTDGNGETATPATPEPATV